MVHADGFTYQESIPLPTADTSAMEAERMLSAHRFRQVWHYEYPQGQLTVDRRLRKGHGRFIY